VVVVVVMVVMMMMMMMPMMVVVVVVMMTSCLITREIPLWLHSYRSVSGGRPSNPELSLHLPLYILQEMQ
jgi:hypothetical protein